MLFEMADQYTPDVIFSGNVILALGFKVGNVHATIENTDNTAPQDRTLELDGKELYEEEFYQDSPGVLKK